MLHQLQIHRQIYSNLTVYYLEPLGGIFERLAYLAGLRDPSTGAYHHERLSPVYGEQPVHEALEKSHEELFERLLETPLAQQENDLRAFLQSRPSGSEVQLKFFEDTIQSWIPAEAPTYLKDLFCSNLQALRELLQDDKPTARSST